MSIVLSDRIEFRLKWYQPHFSINLFFSLYPNDLFDAALA